MLYRFAIVSVALAALAGCDAPTGQGSGNAGSSAATAELAPPAGLSRDDLAVWNSMSDAAKADALAFIADGGTFREFYAL